MFPAEADVQIVLHGRSRGAQRRSKEASQERRVEPIGPREAKWEGPPRLKDGVGGVMREIIDHFFMQ